MKNSYSMRSALSFHAVLAMLIGGCLSFVLASCSESNEPEGTSVSPAKGFTFTVVPWGGDVNGNTRASGGDAKNIGTVSVGNNISGYVNMHSEKPEATTRASDDNTSTVADGSYTIVAYLINTDGTYTKSRTLDVIGKDGIFTTTDGKEARFSFLPDGTYRFMCYNKYLTLSEDGSTLSLTSDADAAANALVGYSDEKEVKDNTLDIAFALKHPYARFKIRLAGTDMSLGVRPTKSDVVPTFDRVFTSTTENSNINFDNSVGYAGTLAVTGGSMEVKPSALFSSSTSSTSSSTATDETATNKGTFTFSIPQAKSTFDKGTNVALDVPGYANSSYYQASEQTAYCYVPAGLSPKAVTLNIAAAGTTVNGTVYKDSLYGEPLSGTPITLSANTTDASMQAGHSYIFTVNLSYNYNYVFSDYSVGTLAANPNKKPIALVTSSKTKTAMALHDAYYDGTTKMLWSALGKATQVNSNIYPWKTFFTASHGWHETYLASYTIDGTTVKATSNNYPAFYAAAHYNPSAPSAPVQNITVPSDATDTTKTWYLPSYGDISTFYQSIGGGNFQYYYLKRGENSISGPSNASYFSINNAYPWKGCKIAIALEQAGGDFLYSKYYWVSTQLNYNTTNSQYPVGCFISYYSDKSESYNNTFCPTDQTLLKGTTTDNSYSVRPFINY